MISQKSISLKELAQIAGVSITTVSGALRDRPDISKKTKASVRNLAQRLNYHPNEIARNLVLRKSHTLGLSISELDNPLYGELANLIEKGSEDKGYSLLLSLDPNPFGRVLEFLRGKKADGFIIGPVAFSAHNIEWLVELKKANAAFVIFGNIEAMDIDSVTIDREKSVYKAIKYLIGLGHRDFGYLCLNTGDMPFPTKLSGFEKAIMECGLRIRPKWLIRGPSIMKEGYLEACELLNQEKIPTAIFCSNDLAACGALKAIAEKGLKVPQDISIVGFDNIELGEFTNPPLTSIDQPKEQIAESLMRVLLEKIENPEKKTEKVVLPAKFIVRESTGPRR